MNLYAYVGNDPMNATDPTGLWLFYLWAGGGAYDLFGGEASVGIVFDLDALIYRGQLRYRLSGALNVGIGAGGGASTGFGIFSGDYDEFSGLFWNILSVGIPRDYMSSYAATIFRSSGKLGFEFGIGTPGDMISSSVGVTVYESDTLGGPANDYQILGLLKGGLQSAQKAMAGFQGVFQSSGRISSNRFSKAINEARRKIDAALAAIAKIEKPKPK